MVKSSSLLLSQHQQQPAPSSKALLINAQRALDGEHKFLSPVLQRFGILFIDIRGSVVVRRLAGAVGVKQVSVQLGIKAAGLGHPLTEGAMDGTVRRELQALVQEERFAT